MKKKIICMVIIFFLMLIIPFFTIKNKDSFIINNDYLSKNELCQLLYNDFKPEYETETLKALAIILQTNYINTETDLKYMSKEDFYSKFGDKSDEYNKLINKAVETTYKKIILHSNNKINISYSYVLNSSKVATPWDCLKAEYKNGAKEGISLNTVNQLCKMGYSYQKALNYFLKDIKIETAP